MEEGGTERKVTERRMNRHRRRVSGGENNGGGRKRKVTERRMDTEGEWVEGKWRDGMKGVEEESRKRRRVWVRGKN